MENFESKYDLIEGLIIALNMGKEGNIPLKNQLVVMKISNAFKVASVGFCS